MADDTNYTNIDRPYDSLLERSSPSSSPVLNADSTINTSDTIPANNGNVETQPVKTDGSIGDVWINTFIRSENWKPKSVGFYIDGQTGYAEFSNVFITGGITVTTGTIGGFTIGTDYIKDLADSMGLSSTVTGGDDVRFWAGATFANRATAPFNVTESGAVAASNITITGGAVSGVPISGIPNSTVTDISLLEKTHNLVFSVTDADTIAWSSGTIVFSNGRTFTISSGNTGNMVALTYIYLDPAVSITVLQTTSTYSTAMGANKSLLGMAQNNTVTASFIPYGAGQPLIDGANIGALSIVAGNIAAASITAGKISVSQLSAISADLGTITAGSITINGGVASISSTGAAIFKSIQVGGSSVQYTLNDSGIFSYGDGSDGTATFDGSATPSGSSKSGSDYTLTRDVYYTNMTLSTGTTVNPAGYRIFVNGTLTLNGTAVIKRNGNGGGAAGDGGLAFGTGAGGGGSGGAALADGYLKGSVAGRNGSNGGDTSHGGAGIAGTDVTNSLGSNGSTGGSGGNGNLGDDTGGVGAVGGTATTSNVKLIANWHLATLLDIGSTGTTIKFTSSAGSGGAGGGGDQAWHGGNVPCGGGGGGGGSPGGIVAIYARIIVIGASASITVNGGNGSVGGIGFTSGANSAGGGGGGAGGNGGILILVYNQITNSGSLTVTGGIGAIGGAGGTGSASGTTGSNGSAGVIYQFQLSL